MLTEGVEPKAGAAAAAAVALEVRRAPELLPGHGWGGSRGLLHVLEQAA